MRTSIRRALAVSLAVGLLALGSTAAGAATGSGSGAKALGTAKAAKGEPITVGFFTEGKSEALDNSIEITSAGIAVDYINDYLGGVAGRPLKLQVCEGRNSPAGATACANEFAAAGVPIVLAVTSGNSGTITSALNDADIPIFWPGAPTEEVQTLPNALALTNSTASLFTAPAAVAKAQKAKAASEITVDVAGALDPVRNVAAPLYEKLGIDYDIVAMPLGTADMTPQVQATLAKNPDMVHIIGNDAFCISALKALKTLGFDGETIVIAPCIGATTAESVGGLDGIKLITNTSTDPRAKETKLYLAAAKKYEPSLERGVVLGNVAPSAWVSVLGFARLMSGYKGEVTSTNVIPTLRAAKPIPVPLADGVTAQCDGTQVTSSKNVCSRDVLLATLDAKGTPKSFKAVDLSVVEK